jgi:prenyltransferase beta subunit
MAMNKELPEHVKEWEHTNPIAYKNYTHEFYANREEHIPEIIHKVEPIADSAVSCVRSSNVWACFKTARQQLEDPYDNIQVLALYDSIYDKLELEDKKKLAYHFAY